MPPAERPQAGQRHRHIAPPYTTLRARLIATALGMTKHPFVVKIAADNLLLLAPLIAFNLLMSLVPILVLIMVLVGFVLNGFAPHAEDHLIALASARTGNGQFFKLALYRVTSSANWVIVLISLLPSLWFGSELFVVIEYCCTRIFHLPTRPFLQQRLLALRLVGIYVLLIPPLVVIAALPSLLSRITMQAVVGDSPLTPFLFLLVTLFANWVFAATFFFVIYVVMPGGQVRNVWRGALIAGALVAVYMAAFPRLAGSDLSAKNDGLNAGFALAALAFFYCFSLFLLLGAEMNAYWAGIHQHQHESSGANRTTAT